MINEKTMTVDTFRGAFGLLLDDIFDTPQHFILDGGDQLVTTLREISADEASERVSSQTASLAAQVNHLCVYIEGIQNGPDQKVDWDASWTDVTAVDEAEWAALIQRVERNRDGIRSFVSGFEDWNEQYVGGAIAILAHTAYHLGEIRTGIGVIRDRRTPG